jgi:hypothetical protein
MAKRGRDSIAALTAKSQATAILIVQRPDAPYELTDDQADVWRRVAEDLPADWFTPKNYDLLAQHTRHVINARRCASLIEQEMKRKSLDLKEYDNLLRMQERETRAILATMTQMRTTHQSLYDKKIKLDGKKVSKPWEVDST